MTDYFITISAQQKANKVRRQELEDVQFWLSANGARFICRRYESTGKYNQLHFHGIARFQGRFQGLVSWGDAVNTDNSYSIRWVKVTNYYRLITYLLKEGSSEAYSPFQRDINLSKQYINITPRAERTEKGGACGSNFSVKRSHPLPPHYLSNILKRTL